MLKKSLSLMLVMLLVWTIPVAAGTNTEKEKQFTAKVKTELIKLGTGPSARVEVKLRDKRKLKGYIDEATDEHFILMDAKTGAATIVPYTEVKQVKGNNLSTGAKVAIGVAIGAAILAVLFFIGKNSAQ